MSIKATNRPGLYFNNDELAELNAHLDKIPGWKENSSWGKFVLDLAAYRANTDKQPSGELLNKIEELTKRNQELSVNSKKLEAVNSELTEKIEQLQTVNKELTALNNQLTEEQTDLLTKREQADNEAVDKLTKELDKMPARELEMLRRVARKKYKTGDVSYYDVVNMLYYFAREGRGRPFGYPGLLTDARKANLLKVPEPES